MKKFLGLLFLVISISFNAHAISSKKVAYGFGATVGTISTGAALGISYLGATALYLRVKNFGDYKNILTHNNCLVPKLAATCVAANCLFGYFTKKAYNKYKNNN
ncbi:MAG: hypothetical protein P4L22_04395 [Candidatus Babeliales bacterium]|nr:hypothetical protein [Candidatus Babeliales bacterium]